MLTFVVIVVPVSRWLEPALGAEDGLGVAGVAMKRELACEALSLRWKRE